MINCNYISYVYLYSNGSVTKIGWSTDPEARARGIKLPDFTILEKYRFSNQRDATRVEKQVQVMFKPHQHRFHPMDRPSGWTEFFDLSPDDIRDKIIELGGVREETENQWKNRKYR